MGLTLVLRTRNTTVFMENNEISNVVGTTSIRQLFYNVVSSVDSMRVGENEPHFLCKVSIGTGDEYLHDVLWRTATTWNLGPLMLLQ